jgi:hypothetical protein
LEDSAGLPIDGDASTKRNRTTLSEQLDARILPAVSQFFGQHCASSSAEEVAAGSILFKPLGVPTSLSHVFSHVIHDLEVHRWVLCGSPENVTNHLPPNVEARWEDIEGLVEKVGMTSWTVKTFFCALGKDTGFASDFKNSKAWKELQARWKKGGMKCV